MRNVRVAHWGFGAMGAGIANVLLGRPGVEIVAACDTRGHLIGKSVFDLAGTARGEREDVFITDSAEQMLGTQPDIVVIATDSFVKDVFSKVMLAAGHRVNVITIAEEMFWPRAQSPALAEQMDKAARENGVTVLGTGINPGMMMDLLAVFLSGCMTEVNKLTCRRVNSLSPFGETVMAEQGIGLTPEAFEELLASGEMAGHVGFRESIGMMAEALSIKLDTIETSMAPIVTDVYRKSPHGEAPAGHVAGVDMRAEGRADGQIKIDMRHPQQIEPQLAGVQTGDYITLRGLPPVNMAITPEVEGGTGTIAMCANMLPFVVAAAPGLKTMLDMPVPRCVTGDYRLIAFGEV